MKKILPDRVLAAKIPRTLILSSTQVILEIYCFVLTLDCILPTTVSSSLFLRALLQGIVSRDSEQIQWIPNDRSEECRVTGAYFFPVVMPFSCFNSKNACFGGFSFDSYSANDK